MDKKSLFKDVKQVTDIKQIIENNIDYICDAKWNFMEKNSLETAIKGLSVFPQSQEKNFVSFVKRVDKIFYSPGSYNANALHKFPVVLAGCIYYCYNAATIRNLTLDEIVLLAIHSFVEPPEFYQTAASKYGKELLATIIEKTNNEPFENMALISLADTVMQRKKHPQEAAIEYIRTKTKEELLEEEEHRVGKMFRNSKIRW